MQVTISRMDLVGNTREIVNPPRHKHVTKAGSVSAIIVPNKMCKGGRRSLPHQVPCLLRDPLVGRMGCDAHDMDAPGRKLNKEKPIQGL